MSNKKTQTAKKTQASKETVAMPVVPTPVPIPPTKTEAEKIWSEIKDLPIQMFGLPDQFVSQHCSPTPVDPGKLYVLIRSSAALPALETAVAPKFTVELVDKYIVVSRVSKFPSKR